MKQLQELTAFIPAAGYGTRMGDICKKKIKSVCYLFGKIKNQFCTILYKT